MRHGRLPWISVLVVVALGIAVFFAVRVDPLVPERALQQVGLTVAGLGDALSNIGRVNGEKNWFFRLFSPMSPDSASRPVLVNHAHPIPNQYTPAALVNMEQYCDPTVVLIKEKGIKGEKHAVDALMTLFQAAIDEGIGNWQISEGYRSIAQQQQIWDDQKLEYLSNGLSEEQATLATAQYVATPGCSEHHTGLAFDVTVPGQSFPLTEQSAWLNDNCWRFGFIIRYAQDKVEITGINAEPWHVRYVGQPHAEIMRENNWCLEEYLDTLD